MNRSIRRIAIESIRGIGIESIIAIALCLWISSALSDGVLVPGGELRSILPTGTSAKTVKVAPYKLDRVPVTNEEFLAFVRAQPQWQRGRVPAILADGTYLAHWSAPLELGANASPNQPVTGVSWYAARAYCEANGARLPTWYEWELAAAASSSSRDARQDPAWRHTVLGWYSQPSNKPLARVGATPANIYGVQDLHGLVWEWVEDFNSLMIASDSRNQGDPDVMKYCGSGALALEDRENYPVAMRIALLSSLEAKSTTVNLGFRCTR